MDFEGLDTVPLVLEPPFYLLHRATATILDPALAATLKVFVLDEAWRFPARSHDSGLRHRSAQDVAQKNACPSAATVERRPERSELLRGRDRELSDACVPGQSAH